MKIFDNLLTLFKQRENIPDNIEFPTVRPLLDNYYFPTNIFYDSFLEEVLNEKRIFRIRTAITAIDVLNNHNRNEFMIEYKVPWF